jgi:lysophospholipase L1-like esterase
VIAHVPAAAQIVVIGDSKTAGSNMSYTSYADLIAATGRRVANFSGTGDRTVEAVQTKANYVTTGATHAIMCVGRNDLASGVSSGTWQANYASIVTDLKAAGMTVIHLVIPETVQSQTTLTSWITSTYPSDTKQYLASWVNATHLGADGIHPNLVGQQFIADTLVNSGVLPAP